MTIHTPTPAEVAALIYAAAGSPTFAHLVTDAAIDAACAEMDRVAARDVDAAYRAGNLSASMRAVFDGTKDERDRQPGRRLDPKVLAARVRVRRAKVIRAIAGGAKTGRAIRQVTGLHVNDMRDAVEWLTRAGLAAQGNRGITITDAGRAWMEARQ